MKEIQYHYLLSKYDPLARILLLTDFNNGMQGWQTYGPDYDGWDDYPEKKTAPDISPLKKKIEESLDPNTRWDRRLPIGPRPIPMLSSLTSWDVGSTGSWSGLYALKIPTLPKKGSMGNALRRLTHPRWRKKIRIETTFTYSANPDNFTMGQLDIKEFGITCDCFDFLHIKEEGIVPVRYNPRLFYYNAQEDCLIQKWAINDDKAKLDGHKLTYLEDGFQELGYNRAVTKYQWHYFRMTIDTENHEYVDFNCNGKEFDVKGKKIKIWDSKDEEIIKNDWNFRTTTDNCSGLFLVNFQIVANNDRRVNLWLDSIVISASED